MNDPTEIRPAGRVSSEPVPDPTSDPVEQLSHLVPALWRTMKRASRAEGQLPANESQVTILRLVVRHDGLTPTQLSDLLSLARATVSNLLKGLVRDGLVYREISREDARKVTIEPTERGRKLLETFRQDRIATLRRALEDVPDQERIDVGELSRQLRRLLERMETIITDSENGDSEEQPADD